MDEVTVVEASLTVVLDIIHPPWDLGERQKHERQGDFIGSGGRSAETLHSCSAARVGAKRSHVGNNEDGNKR